jgi:hypothetical protein
MYMVRLFLDFKHRCESTSYKYSNFNKSDGSGGTEKSETFWNLI